MIWQFGLSSFRERDSKLAKKFLKINKLEGNHDMFCEET